MLVAYFELEFKPLRTKSRAVYLFDDVEEWLLLLARGWSDIEGSRRVYNPFTDGCRWFDLGLLHLN